MSEKLEKLVKRTAKILGIGERALYAPSGSTLGVLVLGSAAANAEGFALLGTDVDFNFKQIGVIKDTQTRVNFPEVLTNANPDVSHLGYAMEVVAIPASAPASLAQDFDFVKEASEALNTIAIECDPGSGLPVFTKNALEYAVYERWNTGIAASNDPVAVAPLVRMSFGPLVNRGPSVHKLPSALFVNLRNDAFRVRNNLGLSAANVRFYVRSYGLTFKSSGMDLTDIRGNLERNLAANDQFAADWYEIQARAKAILMGPHASPLGSA